MSKAFIEIEGLKKYFDLGNHRILKAVNDVSFSIRRERRLV